MSSVTLTFDSSPVKGEGMLVGVVLLLTPPCGFWIKSRMTVKGMRNDAPLWIPASAGNDGEGHEE